MTKLPMKALTQLSVSIWFICMLLTTTLQAALSDYSDTQQRDYAAVAAELSAQNAKTLSASDIEPVTYWVDATNGIDDYSQTGQINQPWKSISWAMNNIPFSKNEANIVIREGIYQPETLYIGKERGGSNDAPLPFNILAFPNEKAVLDGMNVATNGAIISIAGAENITISGLEFTNLIGSWKSAIYVNDADLITISGNNINNAKWTTDPDAAESPTLADRLNAITITGKSTNIMIKNNTLDNIITGYGDPILVTDSAEATLTNNTISNTDTDAFSGQRYYVSPTGDDEKGIGTLDKPWQTIHKALFTIPFNEDDATVIIRGGTYKIPTAMYFGPERGGSKDKYFTVKSYRDEEVIIDGSLLSKPFSAMAAFSSTAYVRIKGLTFANLKGPKSAIYIADKSHHIRIVNNVIRDMTWVDEAGEDEQNPKPSDNLNPIAVIGNHPTESVNNIFIRGNQLSNIVPGYSEGIKIVGNVTDFVVAKNHIHNIANIGIVAAGNYTWIKDASGNQIPNEVNHARNGVIRNNVVHNAVSPVANSAGIYLDGARNVTVRGNTSYNNSVGFSVGCEQPGDATGNVLKRNIAYDNADAGLVVGTIHTGASVNDTTIVNNEFRNNYSKGEYGGELTIQSVNGLKVHSNLFSSRSDVIVVVSKPASQLSLDKNLYHSLSDNPASAVFDWGGIDERSYIGLRNYQTETCHDLKSLYQDVQTIKSLEKVQRKFKRKGKNKALRKIKRSCYQRSKIW